MNKQSKQVIVMRKDLGMRKGKMISQGSHASLGSVLKLMKKSNYKYELYFEKDSYLDQWLNGVFTKITLGVNSEEELIELHNKALEMNIPTVLITDSGKTEFHNIPTITCIAIGPYFSDEINKITSHLKLL